jgi:23S rRNA pseudouridine1911/1915/1917 synthase
MALNDGFTYTFRADAGHGTLLDQLAHRYPHTSRPEWRARIEAGRVLVEGRPAAPEATLDLGQTVCWRRPPWDEPEAPLAYEVLFDDAEVLAVRKPAGLPTLPGAGYLASTLLAVVRRDHPHASPLHRLGRWTSGVVLFARTASARADLARQWADRTIGKRYRAHASGDPTADRFVIEAPIGPVPHARLGTVHAVSPLGKPAVTEVTLVRRRGGGFLCDVRITTGRPHQIRAHLAAAGHPLVGDPLYAAGGAPYPDTTALPGDPGYLLHAAELTFRHPRDGRVTVVVAPPPAELV